jgi:hypothetical protein
MFQNFQHMKNSEGGHVMAEKFYNSVLKSKSLYAWIDYHNLKS